MAGHFVPHFRTMPASRAIDIGARVHVHSAAPPFDHRMSFDMGDDDEKVCLLLDPVSLP
jgi:uncharacterized Zn-finger protein